MITIPSIKPLTDSFEALTLNYMTLGNQASDWEHVSAIWTDGLHRYRLVLEQGGSFEGQEEFSTEFMRILGFGAKLARLRRGGGLSQVSNPDDTEQWLEHFRVILSEALKQGSEFAPNFMAPKLQHSYSSSPEEALIELADLKCLEEFESSMDMSVFHGVLKNLGIEWVFAGRTELIEFAVKTGYEWPKTAHFNAMDAKTLTWFLNHGYSATIKNESNLTLREVWNKKTVGHTQKQIGSLVAALGPFEQMDPAAARKILFESMWTISRGVLQREAKRLNLDLTNPKYRTEIWQALCKTPNYSKIAVASSEVVSDLLFEDEDRFENGVLIGLHFMITNQTLDSSKPHLMQHVNQWSKYWKSLSPTVQLSELFTAAKFLDSKAYANRLNETEVLLNEILMHIGPLNTEQEKQVLSVIGSFCQAQDPRFSRKLYTLSIPEPSRTFQYIQKPQSTIEGPRERFLKTLFSISDEAYLAKKKETCQFFSYWIKTSFKTSAYHQDPKNKEREAEEILIPGERNDTLFSRLAKLNIFNNSPEMDEAREVLRIEAPDLSAVAERYFLNQMLPQVQKTNDTPKQRL